MAKAKTYEITKWWYCFNETCSMCSEKPTYRAFYYPTVMNWDAEWIWDFCEKHKSVDLKKFNNL